MPCPDIAHLPHVVQGSSQRVYVNLPVYVLALRKLKLGIMLVTDFTPNEQSLFQHTTLGSLPSSFVVGGKPVPKSQIFSISISASRVDSVWEKMDSQFRLRRFDPGDSSRCDVSELGIVAFVNFRVQSYQGHLEGFLGQLVTCGRRSESSDSIAAHMQDAAFHAFMARLGRHMNETLYDEMERSFPIERYMDRGALSRHVRPKLESRQAQAAELRTQGPIPELRAKPSSELRTKPSPELRTASTPELRTQAPKSRLSANEVFYQQQETQVSQRPAGMYTRASSPEIRTSSASDSSAPTNSSTQIPHGSNGHRQVLQTQVAPSPKAHPGGPAHSTRYSVHRLHQVSAAVFRALPIEQIAKLTTFEFAAEITRIWPNPSDLFVKPYGKTIRVAPFSVFLGDIRIELHTVAEACTFFGVDEIEILIHHIHEYSCCMQALVGQLVKVKVERRSNVLPHGYERPYWGFASTMHSLKSWPKERGEKRSLA